MVGRHLHERRNAAAASVRAALGAAAEPRDARARPRNCSRCVGLARRSPTGRPARCPTARSSGSRSRARSRPSRRCCCSTSRPPAAIAVETAEIDAVIQQIAAHGRRGRAGRARHEAGDEDLRPHPCARPGPHAGRRHGRGGARQSGGDRGLSRQRRRRRPTCCAVENLHSALRPHRGAARRLARGRGRRDRRAGRQQRRRQDHAAARDLRRAADRRRRDHVRRPADRRAARRIARVRARHRAGAGRPAGVRAASVEDNLRLGAWTRRDADIARDLDEVYATFPGTGREARTSRPARCRAASSRCWRSAAR